MAFIEETIVLKDTKVISFYSIIKCVIVRGNK